MAKKIELTPVPENRRGEWAIALTKVGPFLGARDRDFAESLFAQHRRTGRLSDKQWMWVRVLAIRGMDRAPMAALQDVANF
jgi:hypothetical protein